MDCRQFIDGYSEYDDSRLSSADMEAFRRHLDACLSCQRYDRVLRKGRMVARQVPGPTPSDDFLPRLQQRLWVDAPRARGYRVAAGRVVSGSFPGSPAPRLMAGALAIVLAGVIGLELADAPTARGLSGGVPLEQLHVHEEGELRRPATLPATTADPRDWTVARVDRSGGSSYSPLVTGPPAYRAERVAFTSPSPPIRSTLD